MTTRDVFIVCNDVHGLGGVQRFAHTVGRLLAERGHRVRLVGITRQGEPFRYQPGGYEVHVVHERRPPRAVYGTLLRRLQPAAVVGNARRRRWIRRGARTLSRLFATARPGGVIVCAQVWAMEWVAAANRHGMPVIAMSHESYAASAATSRHDRVKRFFADTERLLLLTQADADAWANDGMSNVGVLPNPLTVTPARTSALTEKTVVAAGRLSHEKGFDLLVEAWQLVAARFPDWTLRIYGTGPEEAALRRQVAAAGLTDSVVFLGHTDDVTAAFAEASVLALPSRAEGLSLVLVEAMATGVPCVAFDCAPGVRETITDGEDGLVVTPGHVGALADALCRLLGDDELRQAMGKRALISVRRFSADAIGDRWEREFDNLFR